MNPPSLLLLSSFAICTLLYGLTSLACELWNDRHKRSIPHIGKVPGFLNINPSQAKAEFIASSERLLAEGYAKFKDSMFIVQTSDLPRLVLSTKYLEELRSLPENIISHRESVCDRFLGYWTGLDVVRQSRLHNEICQTTLVQNLPALIPDMHAEATTAIAEYMQNVRVAGSAVPISSYGSVFNIIARINSRVLVGLPLCRDREWLQVAEGYPQDSIAVATDLRPYPAWLRPLVYPFLASSKRLRQEYTTASRKLGPLIAKRRSGQTEDGDKQRDVLQWLLDLGTGDDKKEKTIVGKMLFLTMAGFHASTATAVHVLYDLCAHPEYFTLLRQEIKQELATEDQVWTLSLLNRLRKLDSVIKESQRMNAPGLLGFNRKVMKPLNLSDGSYVPQGLILTIPIHHVTHDPTVYPDPETFNGLRFYNKRLANPDKEAQYQFAAVSATSLGFGYGRFACPGRVFAAAQLKLLLALLIKDFDFAFPLQKAGQRPKNLYRDDMVLPDPSVEILVRKRSEREQ